MLIILLYRNLPKMKQRIIARNHGIGGSAFDSSYERIIELDLANYHKGDNGKTVSTELTIKGRILAANVLQICELESNSDLISDGEG